jgi:nucleoside phosphorylase/tetratricopeptide (TPR) repeat protein
MIAPRIWTYSSKNLHCRSPRSMHQCRRLSEITQRRRLRIEDYSVGWVCALPIELAAATEMLDEEHLGLPQDGNDTNLYTLGRICEHNVVVACLPAGQTGTSSAASVATQMKSKFVSIRFGLMVGIGGGVPSAQSDVRLGDVVISQPHMQHGGVVQYDFGKTGVSGHFTRTGFLNTPPTVLLNALAKLRSNRFRGKSSLSVHLSAISHLPGFTYDSAGPDILFKSTYNHVEGPTCNLCSKNELVERAPRGTKEVVVHYGTIGSGNQVMKDGVTRDRLSSELGGILCFEMEAAGLMNSFPCLVIRGICDYADSHKNKNWQAYAAATAAACAKEVLSLIPVAEVTKTPRAQWFVPFARNERFVGRSHQLNELKAKLFEKNHCSKVAIKGLGGVGKSQIALELAYQTREKYPDCSIFWVPAASVETFEQAYLEIGRLLQVPGLADEKADVKKLIKRHLSQESVGRWLLILDNADDDDVWFKDGGSNSGPTPLIEYVPMSNQGSIVFTTRDQKSAIKMAQNDVIDVFEMDESVAVELFKKSLIDPDIADDHQTVSRLLDQLSYLPLAIVQAAAYINANGISMLDYLSLFEDTEENIIAVLSEDFGSEGRYRELKNPVATTWLISFEQIQRRDPLAAEYLSFMSCLGTNKIPMSLLPPAQPKKRVIDAIGTLSAYSFITKLSPNQLLDDQLFDLHRLVHLATRNWLREKNTLAVWTQKAIRRLVEVFPSHAYHDYKNKATWAAYLPHARYVLASNVRDEIAEKFTLLGRVGLCLLTNGKYSEAENMFYSAWEWRKRVLGQEHPDTLASMAYLAPTYIYQGRWKEAEELGAQVMEISKRVLGREHPSTLVNMGNLASAYSHQGRWKEAEELEVQVVETLKRVLGQEHPDTLINMGNLASTYGHQGRWKEAEELAIQVMETSKKILGAEHLATLNSMANLASTYMEQRRLKEAEELSIQVVEMRKRVLGLEHPDTLTSMANLASTYLGQGRWKEAEELFMQVTETRKRVLGQEHPSTLSSMGQPRGGVLETRTMEGGRRAV